MNKTFSIRLAIITAFVSTLTLFASFAPAIADTDAVVAPNPSDFAICSAAAVCAPKVDNRAARLDTYFKERDMPLAGYGDELVTAADQYNLDWRLVAAIGIRESSGGKHLMNKNPFGWGSAKIPFKNFSEAIVEVTKNLAGADPDTAKYYKDRTLEKKLWFYNGSVLPQYTGEVIAIMNRF